MEHCDKIILLNTVPQYNATATPSHLAPNLHGLWHILLIRRIGCGFRLPLLNFLLLFGKIVFKLRLNQCGRMSVRLTNSSTLRCKPSCCALSITTPSEVANASSPSSPLQFTKKRHLIHVIKTAGQAYSCGLI
eukprot:COSAG02_NODE_2752_length_8098_cov_1.961495_6_plen_133_part_00